MERSEAEARAQTAAAAVLRQGLQNSKGIVGVRRFTARLAQKASEAKVNEMAEAQAKAKAEADRLLADTKRLMRRLEAAEAASAHMQDQMHGQQEMLLSRLQEVSTERGVRQFTGRLAAKVASSKQMQLERLEAQAKEEASRHATDMENLQHQEDRLRATQARLKQEKDDVTERLAAAEREAVEAERVQSVLRQGLHIAEGERESLRGTSEELQDARDGLLGELAAMKQDEDRLRSEQARLLEEKQKMAMKLRKENLELNNRLERVEGSKETLEASRQAISGMLQESEGKQNIRKFTTRLAVKACATRAQEMLKAQSAASEMTSHLMKENRRLSRELESSVTEVDTLYGVVEESKRERDQILTNIEELKMAEKRLMREQTQILKEKESVEASMREDNKSLGMELSGLREESREMKDERAFLMESMDRLKAEEESLIETQSRLLADKQNMAATLREQNSILSDKLDNAALSLQSQDMAGQELRQKLTSTLAERGVRRFTSRLVVKAAATRADEMQHAQRVASEEAARLLAENHALSQQLSSVGDAFVSNVSESQASMAASERINELQRERLTAANSSQGVRKFLGRLAVKTAASRTADAQAAQLELSAEKKMAHEEMAEMEMRMRALQEEKELLKEDKKSVEIAMREGHTKNAAAWKMVRGVMAKRGERFTTTERENELLQDELGEIRQREREAATELSDSRLQMEKLKDQLEILEEKESEMSSALATGEHDRHEIEALCEGLIQANEGLQRDVRDAARERGMEAVVESKLRDQNSYLKEELHRKNAVMEQQHEEIMMLREQVDMMGNRKASVEEAMHDEIKAQMGEKYAMKMMTGVFKKSQRERNMLKDNNMTHLMKSLGGVI